MEKFMGDREVLCVGGVSLNSPLKPVNECNRPGYNTLAAPSVHGVLTC